MNSLLALSRGIDRMNEIIGKAVGWLILAAILVSATNAIIRKAFNTSSNAWLELQWYLYGAAFLLAAFLRAALLSVEPAGGPSPASDWCAPGPQYATPPGVRRAYTAPTCRPAASRCE